MSSGGKELIVNPAERAVSTDINRLQKFLRKDFAEYLRYLLDVSYGTDDFDAGAVSNEHLSQEGPLRAEVIGGLMVRPVNATLTLSVDAGMLFTIDPDAGESVGPGDDDSPYKLVADPGKAADGTLTLTANASGFTRIDVIECQRTTTVTESALRDVFNPASGTFSPSTLSKATQSSLVYRVRTGTPAGGFPGTVQGWLPLAVASVPSGTSTNDGVTFWDVRPLLSDRAPSMQNTPLQTPRRIKGSVAGNPSLAATAGYFDVVYGNRRIGGKLRRGSPGTDSLSTVDFTDTANRSPDMAFTANGHVVTLYLLTPYGLPRWARYTDAGSGSRVPRSPRGIPVLSSTPSDYDGTPTSSVAFPNAMGFIGGTSAGVAVAHMQCVSYDADPVAGNDSGGYYPKTPPTISTTTNTADTGTVNLQQGVDFPSNASEVLVQCSLAISVTAPVWNGNGVIVCTMSAPNNAGATVRTVSPMAGAVAGMGYTVQWEAWLPVEAAYSTGNTYTIAATLYVGGQPVGPNQFIGGSVTLNVQVAGWRY